MMLNKDYSDMLPSLATEQVKFLLVGAYAKHSTSFHAPAAGTWKVSADSLSRKKRS